MGGFPTHLKKRYFGGMTLTFPCIQCKEKVTMVYGVKLCPNCFKGYWLWEIKEDWQQSEDDFLVTEDGKYLVVPWDLDFSNYKD